jgi:hypothetical protein
MRYLFVLIVSLFLWSTSGTLAQVHINANINLGNQPVWGPTGYDYVENYYMPDIEVYYNVPTHRYYYNDRGRWIYSSNMPSRYRNYDLYNSHKVVVNDRDPWRNHENYRNQYSSYRDRHDQQPIRDSHDSKYFENKNHPEHNTWVQQQKHDNGNHFGQKKNGNNGNDKGNNGNGKGHDKGDN